MSFIKISRKVTDKFWKARYSNFVIDLPNVYTKLLERRKTLYIDEIQKEIYKLIDNLENNLISAEDKEKVAKIVDSLDKGTDKQKLRFKTLYHLLPNLPVCYTLDAYAKLEGCTVNAIKGSIARVRNRLINRSTEDDINCIKEINKRVEEQK